MNLLKYYLRLIMVNGHSIIIVPLRHFRDFACRIIWLLSCTVNVPIARIDVYFAVSRTNAIQSIWHNTY